MWKNKMHILNKHSVSLLQLLKNPKSMLLIFKTEREASLCLKSLFPNPPLIETKKMRIRIQVMPSAADINWNFLSTLDGSRSFPAKSLEVIPRLHLLVGVFPLLAVFQIGKEFLDVANLLSTVLDFKISHPDTQKVIRLSFSIMAQPWRQKNFSVYFFLYYIFWFLFDLNN